MTEIAHRKPNKAMKRLAVKWSLIAASCIKEKSVKLSGNCLCGKLVFEATTESGGIYQCHCSKCRRVTGSSANANLIVKLNNFQWLNEPDTLKKFFIGGWVSSFCSECGSKAPIEDESNGICYIPAGSLNQDENLEVTSHIYVGSKAAWDCIGGDAAQKEVSWSNRSSRPS